ncbi:hypothetical protein L9F63_005209 [Diploptera punctata]|uniref:HMG box domain-containing protein n=1 Tax=Diploptera punctata TaxID=6984 RepID=A0AAD7ZDI8_DIPPU|nr:hypothetical protein L9F63_005209 [Diploptera punctata]
MLGLGNEAISVLALQYFSVVDPIVRFAIENIEKENAALELRSGYGFIKIIMALHCKLFGISNVVGQFRGILLNRNVISLPLLQQNASLKQGIEEKLGLPPRPKKPLTPYFRYMVEMRPILNQKNPQMKVTDVVKIIAKEWQTVDEKVHEQLKEEYKKDMEKYAVAIQKYESLLTNEQKEDIKNAKLENKETKEKRKLKKKKMELGKPKRPNSPFLAFLTESKDKRGNMDYADWQKQIAMEWENLPEDTKLPYIEKYKKAMTAYKHEIQIWEEKMIRLGNIDIVRNEALIEPKERSSRRTVNSRKTEE